MVNSSCSAKFNFIEVRLMLPIFHCAKFKVYKKDLIITSISPTYLPQKTLSLRPHPHPSMKSQPKCFASQEYSSLFLFQGKSCSPPLPIHLFVRTLFPFYFFLLKNDWTTKRHFHKFYPKTRLVIHLHIS